MTPACTQPSVEAKKLEPQVQEFIDRTSIPKTLLGWFAFSVKNSALDFSAQANATKEKLNKVVTDIEAKLSALTDMRLSSLITDDEFTDKRQELEFARSAAEEKAQEHAKDHFTFEPALILAFFLFQAKNWFSEADPEIKKKIVKILSSNPTLTDRKALLVAKKPFIEVAQLAENIPMCGWGESNSRPLLGRQIFYH